MASLCARCGKTPRPGGRNQWRNDAGCWCLIECGKPCGCCTRYPMKTPSSSPESPQIQHAITNTGHVQAFALTAENFEPEIVRLIRRMDHEPMGVQAWRALGCCWMEAIFCRHIPCRLKCQRESQTSTQFNAFQQVCAICLKSENRLIRFSNRNPTWARGRDSNLPPRSFVNNALIYNVRPGPS